MSENNRWQNVNANFSGTSFGGAAAILSQAGDIFGKMRANIQAEKDNQAALALREEELAEKARQFNERLAYDKLSDADKLAYDRFKTAENFRFGDTSVRRDVNNFISMNPQWASAYDGLTGTNQANTPYTPGQLGALSARFESGGNSSAVNPDDNGRGPSLGIYQLNSDSIAGFADFIGGDTGKALRDSTNKGETWKDLTASGAITPEQQQAYILRSHYQPAVNNIKDDTLRAMISDNPVLADVMFSSAVQHGPGDGGSGNRGASNIFNRVYRPGMTPEQLINAVYDERSRIYGGTAGVNERYAQERQDALNALSSETGKLNTPNIMQELIRERDELMRNVQSGQPATPDMAYNMQNRARALDEEIRKLGAITPGISIPATDSGDNSNAGNLRALSVQQQYRDISGNDPSDPDPRPALEASLNLRPGDTVAPEMQQKINTAYKEWEKRQEERRKTQQVQFMNDQTWDAIIAQITPLISGTPDEVRKHIETSGLDTTAYNAIDTWGSKTFGKEWDIDKTPAKGLHNAWKTDDAQRKGNLKEARTGVKNEYDHFLSNRVASGDRELMRTHINQVARLANQKLGSGNTEDEDFWRAVYTRAIDSADTAEKAYWGNEAGRYEVPMGINFLANNTTRDTLRNLEKLDATNLSSAIFDNDPHLAIMRREATRMGIISPDLESRIGVGDTDTQNRNKRARADEEARNIDKIVEKRLKTASRSSVGTVGTANPVQSFETIPLTSANKDIFKKDANGSILSKEDVNVRLRQFEERTKAIKADNPSLSNIQASEQAIKDMKKILKVR